LYLVDVIGLLFLDLSQGFGEAQSVNFNVRLGLWADSGHPVAADPYKGGGWVLLPGCRAPPGVNVLKPFFFGSDNKAK